MAHLIDEAATRLILLGQAPGSGDDSDPLMGSVGRRIAELADLEFPDEYRATFTRLNVLDFFPGKSGEKGDRFPLAEARRRVVELAPEFEKGVVIALGRNVLRVFGLQDLSWFETSAVEVAGVKVLLHAFPHPSGVNHWFNDPENREWFGRELRDVIAWEAAERKAVARMESKSGRSEPMNPNLKRACAIMGVTV